jgi:glutamyl-tRNA reductase
MSESVHFRAAAELSGLGALRALSFNHRDLGLEALAHVALAPDALTSLQASLASADVEAFVLPTCNRTEIYWRAKASSDDERVRALIGAVLNEPGAALARVRPALAGRAAAEHLFRVCCGLESLALGEAEILGQARTALDAMRPTPFLRGVVVAALRTGRMGRSETRIGVGALSVASAAVQHVAAAMPLNRSRVLVVGAGATGVKVARHIRALGVGRLVLANRTRERAVNIAGMLDADATALEQLGEELTWADAVVCAAAAPEPLISVTDLERAMVRRDGRPMLIVDLSMPPVVAPGTVSGITRVDLGALEQQVARQRQSRSGEIPKVEAVIERELGHLETWARQQSLRPLVSDLRRKVEDIRLAELERANRELAAAGAPDAAMLDRLSRRLAEQVLAIPLSTLSTGAVPLDPAQAQYLRRLFALDPGNSV